MKEALDIVCRYLVRNLERTFMYACMYIYIYVCMYAYLLVFCWLDKRQVNVFYLHTFTLLSFAILLYTYRAHFRMMKNVPIVGWDVAFSDEGIFLLEVRYKYLWGGNTYKLLPLHRLPPFSQVNLSCNFFKGRFDIEHYVDFLHQHWIALEILEEQSKSS